MRKNTYKFALDTKLPSQFVQPRVVNGDTSNVFEITLTDKGKAITLSSELDKIVAVFRRADGLVYTQDEETGVTRKTTNTISIDVHRDSFRTGQNTVEIVIFSREDDETEEYAGQITTCQGFFTARNENLSDNPQGSLPQLPMLEQLIADANASAAVLGIYALLAFGVYNLKLTDVTWDGADFSAEVEDDGLTRAAFDANKVFSVQLTDSDQETRYAFFECYKDLTADEVFCKTLGGGNMTVSITSAGAHINGSL